MKELTTILSGQSYNTISLFYPCIHYLLNNGLDDISLRRSEIIHMRVILKSSLQSRFRYIFSNNLFTAATFLNFKYRKFEFINEKSHREEVLKNAISFIITNYGSDNKNISPVPPASNNHLSNSKNINSSDSNFHISTLSISLSPPMSSTPTKSPTQQTYLVFPIKSKCNF